MLRDTGSVSIRDFMEGIFMASMSVTCGSDYIQIKEKRKTISIGFGQPSLNVL